MSKRNLIILSLIIILSIIECSSVTDFDKAEIQLQLQGYTDIKNTGYDPFCCDRNDRFSTGFTAKDKSGRETSGCICSGIFKGITIRFK